MKIFDIIKRLETESGTNNKIQILKDNKDNILLKDVLYNTYNTFIQYYIKKVPKGISVGTKTIDNNFKDITTLLDRLSSRIITGNMAIDNIQITLSTFDKDSQEIIFKILKRDLKIGIKVKGINKVWKNLIPEFSVQLANKFNPEKPTALEYYASRKLDGIRGMYIKNQGLFTRQGKKVIGFENTIEKECEQICNKFSIGAIDGEMFSKTIPFEKIQGAVTRNKNINVEEKEQIYFNVFAIIKNFENKEIYNTTKEMVDKMNEIFSFSEFKYLFLVKQERIKFEDVDKIHDGFVAEGYEGIMLRDINVSYSFKRDKYLVKFKKFLEDDFKIVGIVEGTLSGKYENMLGAFEVEGTVDGKKIISEVGSGFSDTQRKEFFNENVIGKLVEIKYQEITPNGSLRFPTFKKFKLDR